MIQAILNFFGLGKKDVEETSTKSNLKPARPPAPARPPINKASVRTSNYYRRRGKYYSSIDDSIIDDIMLLVVLDELFADGDINEYEGEINLEDVVAEEPIEDLLDVDVSGTPVVEAAPVEEEVKWIIEVPEEKYVEPATYTPDPEPVRETASAGSSYSSGSSDYDSGSSDSGSDD